MRGSLETILKLLDTMVKNAVIDKKLINKARDSYPPIFYLLLAYAKNYLEFNDDELHKWLMGRAVRFPDKRYEKWKPTLEVMRERIKVSDKELGSLLKNLERTRPGAIIVTPAGLIDVNRFNLAEERIFEFLKDRAETIQKLRIENLYPNPFLLKSFEKPLMLKNAEQIVSWLIQQHTERGTVTSFGIALQEIALLFAEKVGVKGSDLMVVKGGRRYYIQLKSGPNAIPTSQAEQITQLFEKAKRLNSGCIPLYGMAYGTKEQISTIVKSYVGSKVDYLAGQEFWDLISDDPNFVKNLMEAADAASKRFDKEFRKEHGKNLADLIKEKTEALTKDFIRIYGKSGKKMWKNILEKNT